MFKLSTLILGAALAATSTLARAHATSTDGPPGATVIARHVEAVGGAKALAGITSFHARGSYELPAMNVTGEVDLRYGSKGQIAFTVEIPGFGAFRQGYDGTTAWAIDPQQGARILAGAERDQVRTWVARYFSVLPTKSAAIKSLVTEETLEFEGRPCHKVTVTLADLGDPYVEYYDVETGLLAGRTERVPGPAGSMELAGWVSEYKSFGDIRIGTRWRHQVPQQEWIATYTEFTPNAVDDTAFELPEEIQALLP